MKALFLSLILAAQVNNTGPVQPPSAGRGMAYVAPGTSGNVLTSNGTRWVSTTPAADYITALGAIGATPNANGASVAAGTLTMQPASASFGGVVTTGSQSFAGAKTFGGAVYADGGLDRSTAAALALGAANATSITFSSSGAVRATLNASGLGIGVGISADASQPLIIGAASNSAQQVNFQNTSSGTSATAEYGAYNSSGSARFGVLSTGYSGSLYGATAGQSFVYGSTSLNLAATTAVQTNIGGTVKATVNTYGLGVGGAATTDTPFYVTTSQANQVFSKFENASTNAAATVNWFEQNGAGKTFSIALNSNTAATSGYYGASNVTLLNDTGNMSLVTYAAKPLSLYTNNTHALTVDSTQRLQIGPAGTAATYTDDVLHIKRSGASGVFAFLENSNTGASASSQFILQNGAAKTASYALISNAQPDSGYYKANASLLFNEAGEINVVTYANKPINIWRNNADQIATFGTTAQTSLSVTNLSTSNAIQDWNDNATNVMKIADGGVLTVSPGGTTVLTVAGTTLDRVTIAGASLATTKSALNVTGSLANPGSTTEYGAQFTTTTGGSNNSVQVGVLSSLAAGYTGNKATAAVYGSNSALGTGTTATSGTDGNYGAFFTSASAGGTGHRVGSFNYASMSTSGAGSLTGSASLAYHVSVGSSGDAVGSLGRGYNVGTGKQVGVAGFIGSMGAEPVYAVSAAVYGDNNSTTDAIAAFADGGSVVWKLKDGANVEHAGDYSITNSAKGIVLKSANGHYWRISVDNAGALSTADLGTSAP